LISCFVWFDFLRGQRTILGMPPLAHFPGRNQCAPNIRFGTTIIFQFAAPVKRRASRAQPEGVSPKKPDTKTERGLGQAATQLRATFPVPCL